MHPEKATNLLSLSKDKRRLVMQALDNLSKHLGMYDRWRSIVKSVNLKWEKRGALDTFLSMYRFNIKEVKE
ncbi:hypothetical protein J7L06_04100 [Candidatus Bathyarchaeota archaeon]|nr:hypothetical protein [Candidatus Bathyarchaeota archaeon]